MKKYLLTINGRPAFFEENQIVYCNQKRMKLEDILLNSLKEVKEAIEKSVEYRKSMGWDTKENEYSYYLFYLLTK